MQKSEGKDWKEKVGLGHTIVCLFANCSHFTILLWPHPVKGLCAHAGTKEFDKQPLRVTQNQETKQLKTANTFTSFFLTKCDEVTFIERW